MKKLLYTKAELARFLDQDLETCYICHKEKQNFSSPSYISCGKRSIMVCEDCFRKIIDSPILLVSKIFEFAGAHNLPDYNGACANLHGHEWKIEIAIKGPVNKETGMVIDFKILKDVVNEAVINMFDHQHLNKFLENPTAENITQYIFAELCKSKKIQGVYKVKVWETSTSKCVLSVDDLV